jgi:hypothetical protein
MSASPADKGDQNSYPENYLQPEVKGDGFMFPLRDGAYLLIKMQSAATAVVTMW